MAEAEAAARAHVARFNAAVASGDWAAFAATFAEDATMTFVGVPVGPFAGRPAIERAYREQPPDDTMTVRNVRATGVAAAEVGFVWDAGGTGTMRLRWSGGEVAELVVRFDR